MNDLKSDDVIDGLDCCAIENCHECPYRSYVECRQVLACDAAELIRKYKEVRNDRRTQEKIT